VAPAPPTATAASSASEATAAATAAPPAAAPAPPAPAPAAPAPARHPEWDDDPAHRNAARIARVMVADLLLYHKPQVEQGVRDGTFEELLAHELEDARKTFDARVPAEIRAQWDYLGQALAALIERKRKDLGLDRAT
jgi:hypothetical protein